MKRPILKYVLLAAVVGALIAVVSRLYKSPLVHTPTEFFQRDPVAGAVTNVFGYTPLHTAAFTHDVNAAASLIKSGSDVNARARGGETPLHVAALSACTEIAVLLLDSGADIDARDNRQITPLAEAVQAGRVEMVELLLSRNADINVKADDGLPLVQSAESLTREFSGQRVGLPVADLFLSEQAKNYETCAKLLRERAEEIEKGQETPEHPQP